MEISQYIKQILKEDNITQSKLGELIGTSQNNVANKLTRNTWTVKDLEKISSALGYKLNITFDKVE